MQAATCGGIEDHSIADPSAVRLTLVEIAVGSDELVDVGARIAHSIGHIAVWGPTVADVRVFIACCDRGRAVRGVLHHDLRRLPVQARCALAPGVGGFGGIRRPAALDKWAVDLALPLPALGIALPVRRPAARRIAGFGRERERIALRRRAAQHQFHRSAGRLIVECVLRCRRSAKIAATGVIDAVVAAVDRCLAPPPQCRIIRVVGPGFAAKLLIVNAAIVVPLCNLVADEHARHAADSACHQKARPGLDAQRRAGRHADAGTGPATDAARAEVDQLRLGTRAVAFARQAMRSTDAVGAVVDFKSEAGNAQRGASADTGRMYAGDVIHFERFARRAVNAFGHMIRTTLRQQVLAGCRIHLGIVRKVLGQIAMPCLLLFPAVAKVLCDAGVFQARLARFLERRTG